MPVRIVDGDLVGDEQGVIANPYPPGLCERAAACLSGYVLEAGLGLGQNRAALLGASHLAGVETVEADPEVVAAYGDYDASHPIVATSVQDRVAEAVAAGTTPWTSVLLDVGTSDLYDDTVFLSNLRRLYPEYGSRVVVISERSDIRLPGFHLGLTERHENLNLYLFDSENKEPV